MALLSTYLPAESDRSVRTDPEAMLDQFMTWATYEGFALYPPQ